MFADVGKMQGSSGNCAIPMAIPYFSLISDI